MEQSNDGTSRSTIHETTNTLLDVLKQNDIYFYQKLNRKDSDEIIFETKNKEGYWTTHKEFFGNSENITIKRIIYDYWDWERKKPESETLLESFISYKVFFEYELLNRAEFLIARELILQLLSSSEEKRQKIVNKWPSWNLSDQEIVEEAKERLKKLNEKEFDVIEINFFGQEKESDEQKIRNPLKEDNENKKISIKKELKKIKKLLESLEKIKKCCECLNNGLEKLLNLIYLESDLNNENKQNAKIKNLVGSIKKFIKDFLTENVIERIEKEILPNIEKIKSCLENELATYIISIESLINQSSLLENTNEFLEKILEKITNKLNGNQDTLSNSHKELIESYKECFDKRKIKEPDYDYYETKTDKKIKDLLYNCFDLFFNIDEKEKKIEENKNNEELKSTLEETLKGFSDLRSLNLKFVNYIDQRKQYFIFLKCYSNPQKQFKENETFYSGFYPYPSNNKKTIDKTYIILMIIALILGVSIIIYQTIIKKLLSKNKKQPNYKNNKQKKLFF